MEKALAIAEEKNTEPKTPKGIDPPCWYEVVTRQGKRHEKTYFLLDIAVYDEHLRVKLLDAPPGRAIDELEQSAPTSYADEYTNLPLAPFATQDVSLERFAETTKLIQRMGKNKQIRNYACVFHAKVWDLTSKDAKERWQRAEDVIKGSFYTIRVHEDPWPW